MGGTTTKDTPYKQNLFICSLRNTPRTATPHQVQMTLHETDETVALLNLPWYGGRRDEFGRLEVRKLPVQPAS